jgi:hypothetical protein
MGTITGRYVPTFAEADTAMLNGVSLNAPYPFFWLKIEGVERGEIVCDGAGEKMRLPFRRTRWGDRARVKVQDPVFGPIDVEVLPFRQSAPAQGSLFG